MAAGSPPFGRYSSPTALSSDGSVVVGSSTFDNTGSQQAFRWTTATGMQGLGFINGGGTNRFSYPTGLSADGSVVVGSSTFDNTGQQQEFRWTQRTGMRGSASSMAVEPIASATLPALALTVQSWWAAAHSITQASNKPFAGRRGQECGAYRAS